MKVCHDCKRPSRFSRCDFCRQVHNDKQRYSYWGWKRGRYVYVPGAGL